MKIGLTRQAVRDIEAAHDYYAGSDPNLGTRFVAAIDVTLERIVMFPAGAPPLEGFDELRRARMRRFPYGIFYQPTQAGDLLVVRVLHSRHHHPDALDGES